MIVTSRGFVIISAILFGIGLVLEILGIDRLTMAFLFAGLLFLAIGHAV
jgi:urea transporter